LRKQTWQGYLTTDDLIEVYPEVSRDAERLEAILTALRRRGVDVVDADAEQEPEEDEVLTDRVDYSNLESISSDDTIGLYLKEMSRVPLLKVAEELDLAKRIETGRAARQELERSNGSTPEDLRRELEIAIEDGMEAREHLIKANTRLVRSPLPSAIWARRAVPGPDSGRQPGADESR